MIHAIILAGGAGTRFWPLSRQNEPKQFLRIFSARPLIEETIRRISPLIAKENIYIATNEIYYKKIKSCLSKLRVPARNIFFEPQAKNTLAPIGLLSRKIGEKDKKAVIVVLPSDHYVKYGGRFIKLLGQAANSASKGYIVTLGVKPDRPETGYGYIKIKKPETRSQKPVYRVERFIEKPDLAKAKRLIKDKRYYWNAGIFVFRPDAILQEIRKHAPRESSIINKITDRKSLSKFWQRFASVSIDYAVMEKTNRLMLVAADLGWLDLGSWQALEKLAKKDKSGNIFKGDCINVGSKNTIAWSDSRLLAVVGLDNLIIADTKDALLVCAKDKAQDVRAVVRVLKQKKLHKLI